MKIILSQDVPNLGEEGDVCVVKNGYARNYLLPTGAAVLYNKTNLAIVASRAKAIDKRKEEKRNNSATLKEKLDKMTLTLVVSAGESGKLFGSVTSMMIQQELAKQGIEVEKKRIEIATRSIKTVGEYSVRIHLYEKEFSLVKLVIESEAEVKRQQIEAQRADDKIKAEKAEAAKKLAAVAKAKAKAEAKEEEAKEAEAEVETKVEAEEVVAEEVVAEEAVAEEAVAEEEVKKTEDQE
ncbi:MAG: 50S ribosomal protein L9 [Sphaerochaetaceae bacterium]